MPLTPNRHRLLVLVLLLGAALGGYVAWRWSAPALPPIVTDGLDAEVIATIDAARAAVRAQPRSAAAWGRLGMVLFAHDMYRDARGVLAQAERLDSADARWPYLYGLATILQQPDDGIAALERAARRSPADPALQLRLAEEYLKLERDEEAGELFRGLLAEQPDQARALLGHGQVLARRGQGPEALAALTSASADPTARRSAHAALARVYAQLGQPAAAEAERRRAASVPADEPWPDPIVAATEELRTGLLPRLDRVLRLRQDGRLAEALALSAAVVRDYPDAAAAQLARAKALIDAGAWDDAQTALRRAVELDSQLAAAHLLLAKAQLARQDYAGAEASCRRAVELRPMDAPGHYQLGVCRLRQGDRAGAKSAFIDVVRCQPDHAAAHAELGALLLEEGAVAAARRHLEDAVRLDPRQERARRLLDKLGGAPPR